MFVGPNGVALALLIAYSFGCGASDSGASAGGPSRASVDAAASDASAGDAAFDASADPAHDAAIDGPRSAARDAAEDAPPNAAPNSLREAAAAKGLLYGCATSPDLLDKDPRFAAAAATECGELVPENQLKFASVHPEASRYDFGPADRLLTFAKQHGMAMRGHTLVWHNQVPSWVTTTLTAANARTLLTDHITAVVSHYKGELDSWDVVNEAINVGDGRADGLRKTLWLDALGTDYIALAFRTAAAADPAAKLCYNDFSLESDAAKRDKVLALIQGLKQAAVPIHCLGTQSHLGGASPNLTGLKDLLTKVEALGLFVIVTELDVTDKTLPADSAARDQAVAAIYRGFLSELLVDTHVKGVLTWGLSDKYTWLSTFAPRADGLPVRPLPLDDQMQRTAVWTSMMGALAAAPSR